MKNFLPALLLVASIVDVVQADTKREMTDQETNTWINFFDKLVVTVEKAQTVCEKLAFDVSNLIDANQDAITIARNARAEGRKLPEAAQQHMLVGVKRMVPAMNRCGQQPKVQAAFAKLDLNRKVGVR
jgi:hypothetical protein